MPIGQYQKQAKVNARMKAFELYKTGMSLRDVAHRMAKSHSWVYVSVKICEAEAQAKLPSNKLPIKQPKKK